VTTLVFVDLKPNHDDKNSLLKFLESIINETREYDGCIFCDIYMEDDEVGMIFIENWKSKAHYEKYLAWRIDTGVMEKLGSFLAAPPIIRFAQKTSV
jgi:quinol monooxygenase YgiN